MTFVTKKRKLQRILEQLVEEPAAKLGPYIREILIVFDVQRECECSCGCIKNLNIERALSGKILCIACIKHNN